MDNQRLAAEQYRKVQVETSTTLDLLQLAYSGIIDNLSQAIDALENTPNSYDVFNEKLSTAQQIVSALDDGLDTAEGELAEVLANFYYFIRNKLIECNMEKSLDGTREVITLVEQVQRYWQASSDNAETEGAKLSGDAGKVDVTG